MARLVITNDDGIDAPGLTALVELCRDLGHAVQVVAPAEEQSAVGHTVTETHLPVEARGEGRWAVSGTPADCARAALRKLTPGVDWLVSGINRGANLGTDAYVSGTVAAAREACMLGVPSIAISQYIARFRQVDWDRTQDRARQILSRLLVEPPGPHAYWNVNLPHPSDERTDCEIVPCPLDPSPKDVRFEAQGDRLLWTGDYHQRPRLPDHDTAICLNGSITVSRLGLHSG